jgi:IclR family transcriptional regulator, KDG regulon repressor
MTTFSNAVAVLRLFSPERDELSVTEVSRLLKMPKSSASRLLRAMRQEGLLIGVGTTPRYRLGHLLFEIACLHGRSTSVMEAAEIALTDICNDTRQGGYISVLDGADILVLRVFRANEPLRVVTPLGTRLSAYETANGRAILARMRDEEVRALWPGPFKPRSPNSPQSIDELLRALDQVRCTGWCESMDESVAGVGSVAIGLVDPENHETLGVCVSFPAYIIGKAERRRYATMLTSAAKRIAPTDAFWAKIKNTQVIAA